MAPMPTRRQFLNAAAAAVIPPQAGGPRYQLGCETLPYSRFPLDRAIQGIRQAGYRYIMPWSTHARERVFHAGLTADARAELRSRFADAGLTPCTCYAATNTGNRPEGITRFLGELDLARDFGIRVVMGEGPWYYTKWPNIPKSQRVWQKDCDDFYAGLEKGLRHAESIGVTIAMKPHTGIAANGKACFELLKRFPSERLQIAWDAGNVAFYEGIWPDPDLPDLAPHIKAVCLKDHRGGRAEADFPVPGTGQIDHAEMFRILFAGGFNGPLAVERVDGTDRASDMPAELIDQRIAQARQLLEPLLEKESK